MSMIVELSVRVHYVAIILPLPG